MLLAVAAACSYQDSLCVTLTQPALNKEISCEATATAHKAHNANEHWLLVLKDSVRSIPHSLWGLHKVHAGKERSIKEDNFKKPH